MNFGFGVLIAVLLMAVPGAVVGTPGGCAGRGLALAVGPVLTYGAVALATVPFGAVGDPVERAECAADAGRGRAVVAGLRAADPRGPHRSGQPSAGDLTGRSSSRAPECCSAPSPSASPPGAGVLAVDPEYLGLGLARQHHPLDPGHRSGLADAYGRAAQRGNPSGAVLPVGLSAPLPRCSRN